MINFTVYGEPVAKGRPRFARTKSGGVRTFTPDKTVQAEGDIYLSALNFKPEKPLEGRLSLSLKFYRAKGMPKTKQGRQDALQGFIQPTTKPDLDNLIKTVKDALNGVIWHDDAQIVRLDAEKFYSDTPRTEIQIDTA